MAFTAAVQRGVQIRLLHRGFSHLAFHASVQHGHDRADDLEVAQLFRGDVEQQVSAARIFIRQSLGEVAHGGGELALRPSESLKHQSGETRVGLGHPNRIHQSLIVHEHG